MLSLAQSNAPSPFLHRPLRHSSSFFHSHKLPLLKPISATISPSNSPPPQQQQLYQPFRPPPSPLPSKFNSLDTNALLDILTNRLGFWFEYAPLVPSLVRQGFSPSSIEELTGISGVLQNILVVSSKVRESLVQSKIDPEILSFFDTGGAELLYEIRLLSASQRVAAVRFLVENKLDAKGSQELARAMKDFPRRRGDKGWESFNYTLPGDCLAFMYYRQALEHANSSETRKEGLEKALGVVESDDGKRQILNELEGKTDADSGGEGAEDAVKVPVVRMKLGEVAETSTVVVLPVCNAEDREKEVVEAPWECKGQGEFGVVESEKGWSRWVVLPGWMPVVGLSSGGVVIAFRDARVLPWKTNRLYKEEAILVVADRGKKEVVADDGFYLVGGTSDNGVADGLKVERGKSLKEMGVEESLGIVVLVVRPPTEENDDQLSDEDWE